MTVKELIQELRTYDENHHVVVDVTHNQCRFNREIEDTYFNGFCVITTKSED